MDSSNDGARSRLVRMREAEEERRLAAGEDRDAGGQPAQRRSVWRGGREGAATEAREVLGGLNTVGVIVITSFLMFLVASASASSRRDAQPSLPHMSNPQTFSKHVESAPYYAEQAVYDTGAVAVPSLAEQKQSGEWLPQPNGAPQPGVGVPMIQTPGSGGAGGAGGGMCPCEGLPAKPCIAKGSGRENLSGAAALLAGVLWIGAHVPQVLKVWRTKDASPFSALGLVMQLGASFMFLIYSAAVGHTMLSLASAFGCLAYGFYLMIFIKYPNGKALEVEPSL